MSKRTLDLCRELALGLARFLQLAASGLCLKECLEP